MEKATLMNFHASEAIYDVLNYLTKLHTLKLLALKNTQSYENLDRPTYLKKLTIVTLKNSYLPKLYQAISQTIADSVYIEEWVNPRLCVTLNVPCMELKLQYLKQILKNQPEVTFLIIDTKSRMKYKILSLD